MFIKWLERERLTKSLEEEQKRTRTTLEQLIGYAEGIDITLSERERTEM